MANRYLWGEASQPGEPQQCEQIAKVGDDGCPPPSQPFDHPASLWQNDLRAVNSPAWCAGNFFP